MTLGTSYTQLVTGVNRTSYAEYLLHNQWPEIKDQRERDGSLCWPRLLIGTICKNTTTLQLSIDTDI